MFDSNHQRTVNATQTSFTVVEALAERDGRIGVTELASLLDIPKSTAYKHLITLCELGYVRKRGHEYELGIGFTDLGETARANDHLYITAKQHIDRLVSVTDQPAGIVVEQRGYAVDLYRSWPTSRSPEGWTNSRYLHCSAPGKAILAGLPDDRVTEIIERTDLPAKTDRTLATPSALREKLNRIAERGIAFERGEQRDGRRAVAVPVNREGRVIGAVYVAGSTDRMKSKRFEEDIPGIIISTVKQFVSDI
ncbi:IclR family transcriptional regulator [Halocatena salina]|uniref:IclR family transcriptional regulator n=1 Tax=Halocatena salina TaxID=2934340 RepID=A0A8U0A4X2_9EURY|nr:IclR family transcriptional regulator [Halocatena salina]UPM42967.1 IclR family transcriptional regulator [Halocatena salina]